MRARSTHGVYRCALALIAATGSGSAAAQAPSPDGAQTCIYQPNIDYTKILDDRTILFFMRTRATYQNTLPEQCHSLYAHKRFTYGSASLHRLCAGNLITVLTDPTPGAVSRGNLCKLGLFVPVDADDVDELIAAAKKKGGAQQTVQTVPVQLAPAAEPPPAREGTPTPAAPPNQPPRPEPDR